MTIREFKSFAIKELSTSPSPALDINVLLESFLKKDKTYILLHDNEELKSEEIRLLQDAITKRKTGLPIAYITGHKEFFGLDFVVSPAVLIPKPDTEILVEKAIDLIKDKIYANPSKILMICDMCTGSGCIALSVLRALLDDPDIPFVQVPHFTLVDISLAAMEVAQTNAKRLLSPEEQERVRFVQSDLFFEVPWDFDAILTNPPYIPSKMVDELLKDGRNEPRLALDGDTNPFEENEHGSDGLGIIRRLIPQAYKRLIYNGIFLMETGEYNASEASSLCEKTGFRNTKIIPDLEDQLRVVSAIK